MFRAGIALLLLGIIGALYTTFINSDFPNVEYVQAASFIVGVTGITLMERRKRKENESRKNR
ncbi:MAG: hypothetical protein ACI4XS_03410 [Bacillus sp. (in: firmicutes)]